MIPQRILFVTLFKIRAVLIYVSTFACSGATVVLLMYCFIYEKRKEKKKKKKEKRKKDPFLPGHNQDSLYLLPKARFSQLWTTSYHHIRPVLHHFLPSHSTCSASFLPSHSTCSAPLLAVTEVQPSLNHFQPSRSTWSGPLNTVRFNRLRTSFYCHVQSATDSFLPSRSTTIGSLCIAICSCRLIRPALLYRVPGEI